MPLKHHSETAYLVLLAVVTCFTGFFISLLPHIPEGLPYGVLLFLLTLLYPVLLSRTFKSNRADYEFRLLHRFPAFMVALWIVFELIGSSAWIFHVLQLGFFYLWALPLVALQIAFLIVFAFHVLRRKNTRIVLFTSIFLVFILGALSSEAMGWNSSIQKFLYPKTFDVTLMANRVYSEARSYLALLTGTSDDVVGTGSSSSMSSSKTVAVQSSASSLPALMTSSKPTSLPASGPESAAVLFATLLAIYMGTLHLRAGKRFR
jgi:hypothetical protein